jgi:ribosome maturation protein SDO1
MTKEYSSGPGSGTSRGSNPGRVTLETAVVARYDHGGEKFEILIDPNAVEGIKRGDDFDPEEVLAAFNVFTDSKKGLKPTEAKINQVFKTNNMKDIVIKIVREGQIQLTTEQRREMQEKKQRAIIDFISKNAINPQTGTPHPPQRIETAMREAKVHVDPFRPVDDQIKETLEKIRLILPIRLEKVKVAVRLSPENHGRCYRDIKSFGTILKEEWQSSGHWIGVVEIPAGVQVDFFKRLNDKTRGEVETKIIK